MNAELATSLTRQALARKQQELSENLSESTLQYVKSSIFEITQSIQNAAKTGVYECSFILKGTSIYRASEIIQVHFLTQGFKIKAEPIFFPAHIDIDLPMIEYIISWY